MSSTPTAKREHRKPENAELLSHHVFLLPFKWQKENGEAYDVHDFKEITKIVGAANKKWNREPFTQDRITDYNEFHYFYDYVTEVLYEREIGGADLPAEEMFIAHYSYEIPAGAGRYKILTKNPKYHKEDNPDVPKTIEYELEIDSILLHLYYTGVGILSFHLNNRKYADQEDILYINQYGRRVYPNFYKIPGKFVGKQAAFDETDFSTNAPHGLELAHCITIDLDDGKEPYCERWDLNVQQQRKHPRDHFRYKMPKMLDPFLSELEKGYDIFPVIDDRMFVVCWYGNNDLATRLTATSGNASPAYLTDDWWYRFTFVDGGLRTVQNPEMQEELIRETTYRRWSGYQTLYGVTQYSFVLLTKDLAALRGNNAASVVTHLQTIYYRLAELVLVQRASIQRFSDDITHISKIDGSDTKQIRLASMLSRRYIRFVNRVYFKEATPQQQGIELYDMLQEQSRVGPQVETLKQEIDRLDAYLSQRQGHLLTALATLFVAPSLLLAAYALIPWPECFTASARYPFTIAAAVLAGLLSYFTFRKLSYLKLSGLAIAYLFLLFAPFLICLADNTPEATVTPPAPVQPVELPAVLPPATSLTPDTLSNQ